jgi:hypothetical protein
MNNFVLFTVIVAGLIALLSGLVLSQRRSTTSEVPLPEILLDPVVGNFVDAICNCTSEADERYVSALALLRENPENTAQQIEATYRSVSSEQIGVRKSLLLAAKALAARSLLPLLNEIASEPLRDIAQHDGGIAAEESILRMIAVDGIDAIAQIGDTHAMEALLSLAMSSDRAVQASAVVALRYVEVNNSHYEHLREILPPDRLYLLEIVRANIQDIPQIIDPRRHLRSEPVTLDTRPDLTSGIRRNSDVPSQRLRAPQINNQGD